MKRLTLLFALISYTICAVAQSSKPMRHFMQAAPSPATAIPYGNNPKAGHYAQAGDAKIYYEVYGQGQPLVILHGGIYGSTYELGRLIDSLVLRYQVIAVSTRGHGKSELGKNPLTFEQKANDVLAVINQVTRDSVIVLGFSDGAYTGYKLAAGSQSKVKKLIAIGAGELYPGMRSWDFNVEQGLKLDSAYWAQQFTLMPEPQRLPELFSGVAKFYSQLTVDKTLFSTINCPVLVMAGERDETISPQHVLNTAAMIRNSQLSIIPNCGHPVFLQNFEAVWSSIAPFIKPS